MPEAIHEQYQGFIRKNGVEKLSKMNCYDTV